MLVPQMDFNLLHETHTGVETQNACIEAIYPATTPELRAAIASGLRDYCRLDTLAMMIALERLRVSPRPIT